MAKMTLNSGFLTLNMQNSVWKAQLMILSLNSPLMKKHIEHAEFCLESTINDIVIKFSSDEKTH